MKLKMPPLNLKFNFCTMYMYIYNTAWPLRKLRQSILSGYKLLTWTDNDSVQKYMAPSVTFSLGASLTQFPIKTIIKISVKKDDKIFSTKQ